MSWRGKLALGMVALIATDGILTYWAVHHGYREDNPLMAPFTASPFIIPFKALTALLAVGVVGLLVRRVPKLGWAATLGYGCGVALYVVVLGLNLVEMV